MKTPVLPKTLATELCKAAELMQPKLSPSSNETNPYCSYWKVWCWGDAGNRAGFFMGTEGISNNGLPAAAWERLERAYLASPYRLSRTGSCKFELQTSHQGDRIDDGSDPYIEEWECVAIVHGVYDSLQEAERMQPSIDEQLMHTARLTTYIVAP